MNRSAFRFLQPAKAMSFDGERYVSGLLGSADTGDIQSEHYHRYLFALRFCVGRDVLDIASGEGYGSYCLGQVASSVIGVDANAAAVDFANRTYLGDRVSFKVGRAQSIPVADASVDVAVSFETLEHFREHDDFVAEIRRVLRPRGLLLISSPNRTVYTEEAGYHNEWHQRELDRAEFVDLLAANFINIRLFAQRPLVGSVIMGDDACPGSVPEGFIAHDEGIFHRTDGVPHPPFFVALASDGELPSAVSSVLQNPALLHHLDAKRRDAEQQASIAAAAAAQADARVAETAARAAEAEAHATTAHAQVAEFSEALKAARSDADLARGHAAEARGHATAAEAHAAEAEAEAEAIRLAHATLSQELEEVTIKLAEFRPVTAAAAQSARRVETLRQELLAARRRNEELATEAVMLRAQRDHFAFHFDAISESTAWKATAPARRMAAKMSARMRGGLRSALRTGLQVIPSRGDSVARPASTHAPLPKAALRHSPAEPSTGSRPSDLQRQQNPAWLEPNERADFVRLRGHSSEARIAVVAHVFYADLWPEMAEAIRNVTEPFDLFITLVSGVSHELAPAIKQQFPAAIVLMVDNHGRDIFPFLALLRTGALFGYELICKLHSKRSLYRDGGDEWRKHLIGGILGSVDKVHSIVSAFREDPDLGIVVADGQMFGGREYWISNEERSRQLFRELGLNASAFERQFVGGSMYWIRPLVLRAINALNLSYDDFEPEPLSADGYTAHAIERLVSIVCYDAGMRAAESGRVGASDSHPGPSSTGREPDSAASAETPAAPAPKVHVIANYLPQFHPIPENDRWWGRGFTEWTNTTKAVPLFRGHRQPRLPTDLGFYDLRLAENRAAQADLARRHGITAFSYYYYWFNGRRLLNRPIDEVVASGAPDFPFMLCWANEPWTRNWDGLSQEILLPQDYAPGWEQAFVRDAAPIMRDRRYLRLDGKPILALYRIAQIPDKTGSMARLREAFSEAGFPEIHLVGGWVQIGDDAALPPNPSDLGLDAYFEFPPHGIQSQPMEIPAAERAPGFAAHIYDYGATVDAVLDQLASDQAGFRYRGVMMGWDNTARRGNRSFVFHGATPANFRRWLRATLQAARAEARGPETAVFINAWNEWAEGTYLEPDRDFGTGWLEAVASAVHHPGETRVAPVLLD